jgi:hypothetical protein
LGQFALSQTVMCRASICRINDELVGSGLDLFPVEYRFLWVSLPRSQSPVCRASICRMNGAM